ncbi:MAG: Hsp33 family molecular chaperone HslO [Filifactoraceae bacterium]
MGRILRGTSGDYTVRIFAIESRDMVEQARLFHNTSPVATAALGRLLSGASMMGVMMKGENHTLTLQVKGNGPLGDLICTAKADGSVKGLVGNPNLDLALRESDGKLDVGMAVGSQGKLTVIRDMGMKKPYIGQCNLSTGEIGDDLTAYFAYSEQQPSAVGLGVLIDRDGSVKQSGGFIVQLMPDASEETILKLERNLKATKSVTELMEEGFELEDILNFVLLGLEPIINQELEVQYKCDCSRERMEKGLISIGRKDLREVIEEDGKAELNCHFCNKNYYFSKEDLEKLLEEAN